MANSQTEEQGTNKNIAIKSFLQLSSSEKTEETSTDFLRENILTQI